jgi:hypothetical protein
MLVVLAYPKLKVELFLNKCLNQKMFPIIQYLMEFTIAFECSFHRICVPYVRIILSRQFLNSKLFHRLHEY